MLSNLPRCTRKLGFNLRFRLFFISQCMKPVLTLERAILGTLTPEFRGQGTTLHASFTDVVPKPRGQGAALHTSLRGARAAQLGTLAPELRGQGTALCATLSDLSASAQGANLGTLSMGSFMTPLLLIVVVLSLLSSLLSWLCWSFVVIEVRPQHPVSFLRLTVMNPSSSAIFLARGATVGCLGCICGPPHVSPWAWLMSTCGVRRRQLSHPPCGPGLPKTPQKVSPGRGSPNI